MNSYNASELVFLLVYFSNEDKIIDGLNCNIFQTNYYNILVFNCCKYKYTAIRSDVLDHSFKVSVWMIPKLNVLRIKKKSILSDKLLF